MLRGLSPVQTPATLGSVLFFGATVPEDIVVEAGPVLAYNGAHLVAFLLLGTFMAWLFALAERGVQMWYTALIIFLVAVLHGVGLPIWFQPAVRSAASLWIVVGAAGVAAAFMAGYLWRAHPRLREHWTEEGD